MTTAQIRTGASIGRGFLAAFLGAALLCGAAPSLHAESVEELTAQLAEEEKAAPESLNVANVLGRLADAHRAAGDLDKAEPLYQRALAICEKIQPEHADTATVANNLGMFYQNQNKPDQAEAMYRRALTIREKALGADSAETAAVVRNLVELYKAQGEDAQIANLRYNYPNAVEEAEQPAAEEEAAADIPDTGDADQDADEAVATEETPEEAAEEATEEEAADETPEADAEEADTADAGEADEAEQDMEEDAENAEEEEAVEEN